ncbi:MAG: TerC family protein [Anaerolineae bacterium]|nr:TerC family protein [Anaerolineae bacterium]
MENIVALLTLTLLEVVLGIDNVIFIAILAAKLPSAQQAKARSIGIGMAVITRILLLLSITWIMRLTEPLIAPFGHEISGRDLILLVGGMFLIGKSTNEIHDKLEAEDTGHRAARAVTSLTSVVLQVMIIDIVFSLDSVITAVGISNQLWVMITAILIAAGVMIFFAGRISTFVEEHPTMKILALAFLILIGALLVIEGWNQEAAEQMHLKNYAYFAMAFSVVIEVINMRVRKKSEPVHLHNRPKLPPGESGVAE